MGEFVKLNSKHAPLYRMAERAFRSKNSALFFRSEKQFQVFIQRMWHLGRKRFIVVRVRMGGQYGCLVREAGEKEVPLPPTSYPWWKAWKHV